MKLAKSHIGKMDPQLQNALEAAAEDEILRAVMLLGTPKSEQPERGLGQEQELKPSQFPSRKAYRKALIEQRQNRITDDIGPTMEELQKLSLTPYGGKISRVVVVEGPAYQILSALDLPGVQHASLDQPVELIQPRRPTRKKSEDVTPRAGRPRSHCGSKSCDDDL